MTSRRKYWFGFALFLGGLSAFLLCQKILHHKREPRYGDRPLSYWLEILRRDELYQLKCGVSQASNAFQVKEAQTAVVAMGQDAIPFLLDNLCYEEPRWMAKVPRFVRPWVGLDNTPDDLSAYAGFSALGTNAFVALPQLEQLLNNPRYAGNAAMILVCLGKRLQSETGSYVYGYKENPKWFPVVALHCLNHPDAAVRKAAVKLMSSPDFPTNVAIPKLTALSKDPDQVVRVEAEKQLAKYRTQ